MAVDLLISTLALPRIGFIEDDHVVPMAGNDTFTTNQGKLSCAIECNIAFNYFLYDINAIFILLISQYIITLKVRLFSSSCDPQ